MSNYSKAFGSLFGGLLGWGASKGLPVDFAGPEMSQGLAIIAGTFFTWFFPANKS